MSRHNAHTVANDSSVDHIRSQWEQIQVPTAQLAPSLGAIVPAVTLKGRKILLRKTDQLTFNTWYTGAEWTLSVPVNCDNKNESSFGANYVGFFRKSPLINLD